MGIQPGRKRSQRKGDAESPEQGRAKKKAHEKVAAVHRIAKGSSNDGAENKSAQPDRALKKLPNAKPRFIEPMKARLEEDPPTHGDWLYELKFDGIRAIAIKDGKKVSLISRNGNKLDRRFPEIADAVKELPVDGCVLDGEAVALDDEGRSSFQLLQALE